MHKNANQAKTKEQNKNKRTKNNKNKGFSCIKTSKRGKIVCFAFLKKLKCPDNFIYYTTNGKNSKTVPAKKLFASVRRAK